VARLTGGERGPARGGVGSGRFWRSQRCTARRRGGRNRPVHVRRRVLSSAAGVPVKPRRSSSIQWHGELHGGCRGYLCIESKNGAVTYPVHVRRRGSELRRARFRYSGGAGPRFKLVQASRPLREAIRGLGPSGGGRERG
jgi:hypothetical protein